MRRSGGADEGAHQCPSQAAFTQDVVLADYRLFHIEANVRWRDHTESRLSTVAQEVTDVPGPDRA
jgi:hypothetical protein